MKRASLVRSLRGAFAALFVAVATAVTSQAQLAYHVTMQTSPLQSSPAQPFYLDFQLFDGTGSGNGNTAVTLSNFRFGGGSAVGSASLFGTAAGSLTGGLSLRDSAFYNEAFQEFIPGALLEFDLVLTTSSQSGATPDSFAFAILDNTLSNLPTLAAGLDVFGWVEIQGGIATVRTYGANTATAPNGGGSPIALTAPTFQPVPEPATYGLGGALALALLAWRRRCKTSKPTPQTVA